MITEYHRPQTLDEALALLARAEVDTAPVGGGTALRRDAPEPLAVVDLQSLGLDAIERSGKTLHLGATVTLQALLDTPDLPPALYAALRHETTYNLRQVATVAGTLVAADGRSPFATALLALDAELTICALPSATSHPPEAIRNTQYAIRNLALSEAEGTPHATRNLALSEAEGTQHVIRLGDLLPFRAETLRHGLVTHITLPLNTRLAYEYVARTPADRPIVCAAVAQWPAGRTRVALGGYGAAPALAMDGPEPAGAETAARATYETAGDEWASVEYRAEIAGVLARRCVESLQVEELALRLPKS